jgi:hypothetical protein
MSGRKTDRPGGAFLFLSVAYQIRGKEVKIYKLFANKVTDNSIFLRYDRGESGRKR